MVDVDVEVNAARGAGEAVIGGGEGEETAGEGVGAVKGEDFDEESERWGLVVVVVSEESGFLLLGGDGVGGLGEENEEDDDGDAEEEKEEWESGFLRLGECHRRHGEITV